MLSRTFTQYRAETKKAAASFKAAWERFAADEANLTEFLEAAKIAVTFRADPAGEPRAQIDGKVS